MGSVEADSVLQRISSFGDSDFFGTGGLEAMNGLGETLGGDRFHQIVDGLHIKRLKRIFGVGGDHNELGRVGEGFEKIKSRCARHLDIEKEGIRPFFANHFKGGGFVAGFSDDFKVRMRRKKLAKALDGESLIIAKDYTEHGSPFKSRVATTKPLSSARVKR